MSPRMPTNAAALMASLSTSECFCGTEPFTESNPPIALPCKHMVHSNCIKDWAESNNANANRCPVCRAVLYDDGRPDLAQEQLEWEEELADHQADPRNPLYAGFQANDHYRRARYTGSYSNDNNQRQEERRDRHRHLNRGSNRSSRLSTSFSSREAANRPSTRTVREPHSYGYSHRYEQTSRDSFGPTELRTNFGGTPLPFDAGTMMNNIRHLQFIHDRIPHSSRPEHDRHNTSRRYNRRDERIPRDASSHIDDYSSDDDYYSDDARPYC